MYPVEGKYSTAYVMTDEDSIPKDEYELILKFVNCHVFANDSKIMPDYHWGKGAVIGFTMPLTDKVIPNVVGVDISCNMLYIDFDKYLDFDKAQWLAVDRQVRRKIPMSKEHHRKPYQDMDKFPWTIASAAMDQFRTRLNKHLSAEFPSVNYDQKYFFDLCDKVNCKPVVAVNSLGTLGGGNHFIEFGVSEKTKHTGVTIHSGSRNLGLKVANYWQRVAKENMKRTYITEFQEEIKAIKKDWPQDQWDKRIKEAKKPPTATGLEYLEGDDLYGYMVDMHFCHYYAFQNLLDMASIILETLNLPFGLLVGQNNVHTIHNFIDPEDLIIRKGAVRSYKDQKMLIPFNMEDGILVCEGKSNEDWNFSAPHGAGRLFGRREMKERKDINVRDVRARMNEKGIYLSVVPKDEIKEAYKDPEFIEEAIAPTATIIDRLKTVSTLKADD